MSVALSTGWYTALDSAGKLDRGDSHPAVSSAVGTPRVPTGPHPHHGAPLKTVRTDSTLSGDDTAGTDDHNRRV